MINTKKLVSKIVLFTILFWLLPFWTPINQTFAVDWDWTADLDMLLTTSVEQSSIIWSNFNYNFTLQNQLSSESQAFKNWFILSLPDTVSYVSNNWLWTPTRTLLHTSWNTLYFFETSDFLVEWASSDYSFVLTSDNDALLSTPMDIKVLAYADDNIYWRWPVPTWAPLATLPWWVDFASGTWFLNPADPSDLTFPDNIVFWTDISSLPFIWASTSFIPFDVSKTAPWLALIWNVVTTTLRIEWNSLWALINFHLSDVIPKNRKFVWFTQTWWVSNINVLYNTPTNWQVTLDLSGINVPINTSLDIRYQTLALAYEIDSYTWSTILLNTWALVDDREASVNTVTMLTEWTWFDWTSNIPVDWTTLVSPKSRNVSLGYASIWKSVDIPNPVIWDTLTYTVNVETAKNVALTVLWSWTYITDTLPDGMIFTWAISSTTSWTWTALTYISETPDPSWNWDTTLLWRLNSWIINPDETITIVYQTYVDWMFEWAGDTTYENTDTLINIANFFWTIWDSWNDEEWWITDPSLIWTSINYISSWNWARATVSAPIPVNDKRVLSVTTPDWTVHNSWWIPSKVPVWSALEFLVTMDFPNVDFLNAKVIDSLPLLTWPNEEAYDFAFQTNTSLNDIDGNSVLYNTNDKSSGLSDTDFNWLDLTSTGWISESPANNIEFDLGSWRWNKVFAIKFKVDVLPNIPNPIPTDWLVPLTNIALGSYENDASDPFNIDLLEFPFTVSLPYLTLDKTSSWTSVSAWKDIDYTLLIENTWNASAYVENIVDTLPDNLDLISFDIRYSSWTVVPNSSVTQSWTILNIMFNTWALSPNRWVIEENKTINVNYTVAANTGFLIRNWEIRTNTANLDYYSTPDSSSDEIYNFWPIEDTATFTSAWPTITRTLISSSEVDSWTGSVNDLLIWEEAVFETIITLPWWWYDSTSFRDIIDNWYLDYVTWSIVSISPSLSLENPAWIFTMISNELNINFWDIINNDTDLWSAETIVIHTTERAKNVWVANRTTRSRLTYNWLNLNSSNSNVDLFEPNVSISKTANPTSWDAWDTVWFTVTVSNSNSTAPAYDLELTDIFPSWITFVTWSLNLGDFSWTENDLLVWSWITFPRLVNWAPQTITFSWVLDDDVMPNNTYTNTAYVWYNSLDDDVSAFEKTYTRNNWAIVTIDNVTLTHELYNTDLADTWSWRFNPALEDLAIWETAYFRTIITIPESSFSGFTVVQDLPAWLKFLTWSIWVDNIWAWHSLSNITINPDNRITFDLWDVTNVWWWARTIELLTQAIIEDNLNNDAWDTKISTATVNYWWNNRNINTSLELVEPNVNITKTYSPSTWDWWDSILTTITVQNTWTAPAYDVSWTDILPPKTTSSAWFSSSSSETVVNPWQIITYTYNTILDASVFAWEVLTWTASLSYSSYPLVNSDERSYTDSDTDNISIVVAWWLSAVLNTTSNVTIWDISKYTIRVPVSEWTTNSLILTDIIPAWMSILPWSINIVSSWSVSYSWVIQNISPDSNTISSWQDQTVTWTFTGITNSDSNNSLDEYITITYDAVVLNTNDNNNSETNFHSVSANYNSWWISKTWSTSPVTIIEPSVVIAVTNNYAYWNSFEYLFTVTNTWSSTAYDLNLTSSLPAWVTFSWWLVLTNSWNSVNLTKVWNNFTIDSLPVNTWNPITFRLVWIVDGWTANWTNLILTENITYTNQNWSYTSVTANPLNTERTWAGWINDYTDSDNTSFTVSRAFLNEAISVVDLNWWSWVRWDIFEYTITLTNSWTELLNNIPVALDIPLGFTWFTIQSIPAGSTDNSTVNWWVNSIWQVNVIWIDIPVWESRIIVYRVTSNDDVADGTVIPSTANVWNSDEWAIWWTPSVPVTIIAPWLSTSMIEIDDNWWTLLKDEIITHNWTIQNTWTSTWTNLSVTISYSTSATFQSWSLVFPWWSKINTGSIIINDITKTITFTITDISPWSSETFTFKTSATWNEWDTITTNIWATIDENETSNTVSNVLVIVAKATWGWWTKRMDDCPNWDYSRTVYDRTCWEKPPVEPPKDPIKPTEPTEDPIKSPIKDPIKIIEPIEELTKDPIESTKEVKKDKIESPIDESKIKDEYDKYILKKEQLEKIIKDEKTSWLWLKFFPKVLPKTWTPISERVRTIINNKVELELPKLTFSLAWNYENDINFWTKTLDKRDRNEDEYIVVPSNWLVVPVNNVDKTAPDFNKLVSGQEINVNKYLKDWVMSYPETSKNEYGKPWNKVVFGHSSYWKKDNGRYKTQFQKIIEMDEGEEVWVYKKINGKFERFRYKVEKSYNTPADDVSVLESWIWSNLTLFTCTPIGWITWRWIIKAKYIDEDKKTLQEYVYWTKVSVVYRAEVNKFVNKISLIKWNQRKVIILKIYSRLNDLDEANKDRKMKDIIQYIKIKLAIEYFK